ncbi:MAG: DUF2961 domain-containing protein [Acidobacteria bacterium]|nr:DUF2961 domain-containing protein [Acidobacteriota bacterium]
MAATLPALAQPYNFERFARELIDLEGLSQVEGAPVKMESSWDRAGGNNDAFLGKRRNGDVYTIADLRGPGVVRRFYTARPGGWLRIYIDGNPEPVVDMKCEELFAGRKPPFVRPVTGPMGGANYSYFPIPYRKSIRIETTAIRPAEFPWGVYYQVTYQTFPEGTAVESLKLPLEPADQAGFERVLKAWRNPGSDPKPETPDQVTLTRDLTIPAGARLDAIGIDGAGIIDRLFIRLEPAAPELLRSTLLKIRWDGETKDSVDCPLGDFFGNGFRRNPYLALPMGLTEEGWYSYFSMPFASRARISLVNEDAARPVRIAIRVVYRKTAALRAGTGLFHAKWRREEAVGTDLHYENNSGQYNYHALDAHGQGRFLGLNLNVFNRHTLWWGEGDPMIFVDEEAWPPAIHGTGTEEYFNDAWGFHDFITAVGAEPGGRERNVIPVSGVLLGGGEEPLEGFGGNAVFSFHLADSIPFSQRIVVTFEHGQEQNDLTNDYSSTAYWYALPGGRDFFLMRPAHERTNPPETEWPAMRKVAAKRYLDWIRETLAEFAGAIPHEPNNDRLARPRAVFLMWVLGNGEQLGLPRAEKERLTRAWRDFQGTEPEKRRNVDRILLELARKLVVYNR